MDVHDENDRAQDRAWALLGQAEDLAPPQAFAAEVAARTLAEEERAPHGARRWWLGLVAAAALTVSLGTWALLRKTSGPPQPAVSPPAAATAPSLTSAAAPPAQDPDFLAAIPALEAMVALGITADDDDSVLLLAALLETGGGVP
jgi:hypothetical protein